MNFIIYCLKLVKLLSIIILFLPTKCYSLNETLIREAKKETDEQKLLYYLLYNYEKSVRPVKNASNPIVVRLGLTLTNIFEMDEKNQVLTINVWLDQEWIDELLTWDPKDFGGITSIRIPCDLVWLPDIVLYNNADDYTAGYMRARIMLRHDGRVFWPPPTQLRSTCRIDVRWFPFDTQYCSLKMGSWSYHGFQVDITNRSENVDLTNYVPSGGFDLVKVHQKRRVATYTCCPEPYPDVTFYIHIRRKTLYYMYNVIFPCIMMSILTLLVFYLPPDSGEKVALGITTLLAFSVFVLAIAEQMPETSDSMPLIAIYLTLVMVMTSISVVMTVMVLNLHHRGPFNKPVGPKLKYWILKRLKRFLNMHLPTLTIEEHQRESIKKKKKENCSINNLSPMASILFQNSMSLLTGKDKTTLDYELLNNDIEKCRKNNLPENDSGARLLIAIQHLLKKHELEEQYQIVAGEWKQVAQVIDRLLFWVFLFATIIITSTLLIILPLINYSFESEDLDESLYGLH
uniref:Neuronal acetylcholine receptor subunit alpha-10-like n=1 Tax=Strongyloides stercoralis TaxID=6248 RepID=A0A0K0ERV6_STRER